MPALQRKSHVKIETSCDRCKAKWLLCSVSLSKTFWLNVIHATVYSACPHICSWHLCFMLRLYGSPRRLDINFLTATRHVREGLLRNKLSHKSLGWLYLVLNQLSAIFLSNATWVTSIVSIIFVLLNHSQYYTFYVYSWLWEHEQHILLVLLLVYGWFTCNWIYSN